ncbi:TonB-dependent receptor [Sphingomonas sp. MG17]|uniref:TonB-dependent receptor n=1 Tax=Sphingomonas tagetis TaxID=2949092 RepID=A0A9X2KQ60_9SPHN|nr:TonB-dependent receptor [Sphingomonas tagetis]MCP3731413.1 TonB-dependent receptor [Sphingomonas tagetis]
MVTNYLKLRSRKALVTILLGSSILVGGQAFAQDGGAKSAESAEDEIFVTAQRREQAVIDVPIAVSVVDAEKVEDLNLSTFTSIAQQTPNFNVTFTRGGNAAPNLSIRGIRGDGSTARVNESSVAVYVDDIYLGDENSLTGHMFDVDRVEVLRGPQGTLFGRNTTGGLVQFVSANPTAEYTQKASILYGSDNWVAINGAVSGPITDNIRTRIAGQFETHSGHYTNRATLPGALRKLGGKEAWSLRSTTDFDIGEATKLRVQVTQSRNRSESTPNYGLGMYQNLTGAPVLCSRTQILAAQCYDNLVRAGQPAQNGIRPGDAITELTRDELAIRQDLTSATVKFETDLGFGSLINIANYTKFKSRIGVDGDGSTTPSTLGQRVFVELRNATEQFSNELRLQGETDTVNWVGGLFYYQDTKTASPITNVRNNTNGLIQRSPADARVDTTSGAVFGQIDWKVVDQLTLSAGARYTVENRELLRATLGGITNALGTGPVIDVRAAVPETDPVTRDVTGRASLTWEPTPDNSLYASYSRGAKSVSYSVFYSSGTAASNALQTGPVGQEHIDAFEIGSKNRFLDRTLSLNLAGFYYIFDGKQELLAVAQTTQTPSGPVTTTSTRFLNVGQVEIYGAELEFNYKPSERWDFGVSGGLLHSEITKTPLTFSGPRLGLVALQGRPLPQTPKWNVSGTFAHHVPTASMGTFTLQAEGRAQAEQNFGLSNDPLARVPSYGLVNFRVMWESDDKMFNAQVFVTNAFNKLYFASISDVNSAAGAFITQVGEPRLWGVKFGAAF